MDCWTAVAWAAGATAFALSPGLLLEIPKVDSEGKPNGIGIMTGKTNIWAMAVHALVLYVVMRFIVIPAVQRMNKQCDGLKQVEPTVKAALERQKAAAAAAAAAGGAPTQGRYKSHMRKSYVVQ